MKKFIIFVFTLLLLVGCCIPIDSLDIKSGTKFIVISKKKKAGDLCYTYYLIKEGGPPWYDYYYTDTTDFNIDDTLVVSIKRCK